MKKKIAITMVLIMAIMSITVIAENMVNGSMDFIGEAKSLSLEEALNVAIDDSLAGKTATWNLENAEAAYKSNKNSANTLDNVLAVYSAYGIFGDVGTNKDVKMLEIARDYAKAQKDNNYSAEIMSLEMEVKGLYFQTIQASEMKTITTENLEIKEKLYQDVQKKFELGMVSKQELLTAEYDYLKAKTDLEKYENTEKTAKMGLNMYLGYDVMDNVILTDKLITSDFLEVDLAESISQALLNRNEIGGSKFALDIQQINMDKIKVRYPSSASEYMKQKVAYETALFNFENAGKSIEMDVRNKYMDLIQKQHAIESGQKAVENATEALRLSQLTYEAGMIILTDLQNVQSMTLQAKLGLSQSVLDYNIALDSFNAATDVGTILIPIQ